MFKVRPFENKTVSWWNVEKDTIDLSPSYQRRGGIWSKSDKGYLIDSILNDFDIPKLYIADFTIGSNPLNVGRKAFAVIDGRQRLEAIFGFFADEFALNRDFIYDDDPSLRLAGLKYTDIRARFPRIASKFENFNLSVMSVITDEEVKINELFVRLNRNKPLNGAEVRNAMSGVIPKMIRDLEIHPFFADSISFKTDRGQALNAAAKLLLIEFSGDFVTTKRSTLDKFANKFENVPEEDMIFDEETSEADLEEVVIEDVVRAEYTNLEVAFERVSEILDKMVDVFGTRSDLLSSQGQIPIYYWFVRDHENVASAEIRDFFENFEQLRTEARQSGGNMPDQLRVDLSEYDRLSRSVNDQGSLKGRYQILARVYDIHREHYLDM